jgi:hypothetical protein
MYMKVTSTKSVSFPSLDWGITAGDTRELPEDKDAQKVILAHPAISKSKKESTLND